MPKAQAKPKRRRPFQPEPTIAGAKRLRSAIHIARARAGIPSDAALARVAPVSYDTLMNWYSGATRPRGHELQRVARALDVPYAELDAAYEGRKPKPVELVDKVAQLTDAVHELVAEIRQERRGRGAFREELAELGEALDEAVPASPTGGRRPALRGDGG